jgi:hypothetical protein
VGLILGIIYDFGRIHSFSNRASRMEICSMLGNGVRFIVIVFVRIFDACPFVVLIFKACIRCGYFLEKGQHKRAGCWFIYAWYSFDCVINCEALRTRCS